MNRYEIGGRIVYFEQRKIGGAIVEGDFLNFQFDGTTRDLLKKTIRWREGLPDRLPQNLLDREEAEFFAGRDAGEAPLFAGLYIVSPDSDVFPIDPAPSHPVWVVTGEENGEAVAEIIDAVTADFLGYAVPPPYEGVATTGPMYSSPCFWAWYNWRDNAADWFTTMGFNTESITWPTEEQVQGHIQSESTVVLYELSHGGSSYFASGCADGNSYEYTYASEIESWIASYRKMSFAFIGSCGGMCSTGDGSLSYELRKGSSENTATVGYCGMSDLPCSDECWYGGYTIAWQDALFDYMNQGWTVKAAFDQANADYPACGLNNCMRFAGDEAYIIAAPTPTVTPTPTPNATPTPWASFPLNINYQPYDYVFPNCLKDWGQPYGDEGRDDYIPGTLIEIDFGW